MPKKGSSYYTIERYKPKYGYSTSIELGGLAPGDHVQLSISCDDVTEAVYVEISHITLLTSPATAKEHFSFTGKVPETYRTHAVPSVITGSSVSFSGEQIQRIYEWRNAKSKKCSWRVLSRDMLGCELHNWGGQKMDKGVLDSLQVGEIVRLALGSENSEYFNYSKIYFEITNIDCYKQGGIHRPRKFRGKALDIYMCCGPWDEVRVGEEVEFQRKDVIEIPDWKNDEGNPLKQPSKDLIERDAKHAYRIEQRREDEEYLKSKTFEHNLSKALDTAITDMQTGSFAYPVTL